MSDTPTDTRAGEPSDTSTDVPATANRRSVLRSAGALLGGGAVGALLRPGSAGASTPERGVGDGPVRALRLFQLFDRTGKQRWRISDEKPPIYHDGTTYPASIRNGPLNATWVTFNDENQDEKGGMTIGTNGESLSFDWANAQAVTLSTGYDGAKGAAALEFNRQPDPTIPITEPMDSPPAVVLYTDNYENGSLLYLCDSKGNPRIALQVDVDNVPSIQILDAEQNVIAQLPPDAAKSKPRLTSARKIITRLQRH